MIEARDSTDKKAGVCAALHPLLACAPGVARVYHCQIVSNIDTPDLPLHLQ